MDIDLVRLTSCIEYIVVFCSDLSYACLAIIINVRLTGRHDKQLEL